MFEIIASGVGQMDLHWTLEHKSMLMKIIKLYLTSGCLSLLEDAALMKQFILFFIFTVAIALVSSWIDKLHLTGLDIFLCMFPGNTGLEMMQLPLNVRKNMMM